LSFVLLTFICCSMSYQQSVCSCNTPDLGKYWTHLNSYLS
jgi:hypothetical protein